MKKNLFSILIILFGFTTLQANVLVSDFLTGLAINDPIEKGTYTSIIQDDSNPIMINQWNLSGREDAHYFRSGSSPVVTDKLLYPGYVEPDSLINAIKLNKFSSGGRMTVYSLLSDSEYSMKPYYLAFMLRVDDVSSLPENNDNDFISFDGNYTGNHLRGRLILRKTPASNEFAFALGGLEAGQEQTTTYKTGQTLLIVLKYNFFTSDRSTSLYINPVITDGEPVVPDLKLDFEGIDMLAHIRGISLRQSTFFSLTLGGLRFADNWNDALGYKSGDDTPGSTTLVDMDTSGKLVYTPDPDGFYLPDFSFAGYEIGIVDFPQLPVVKTISPVAGDNTAHIQTAIDEVGQLPLDASGFRGALLLQAGKYVVAGTLYVKYSGVVIRGVGNGTSEDNSTIIYATGDMPHQRNVVVLGYPSQNTWSNIISGTQQDIMDDVIPVGANSFSVADSSPYKIGDRIVIYHPCTEQWLQAVNFGGVPAPAPGEPDERWTVGELPIVYNRIITQIEGEKVTVDAPVYCTLDKSLSQSYIYKYDQTNFRKRIGIENLRIEIESLGGTDENHAWSAVRFRTTDYCHAKDVIVKGFGLYGISTECTTRSTIENCQAIDPVSELTGERRYNFNAGNNAQLILYKNCFASKGRHNFVVNGMSSASGIVFLNCISDSAYNVSEAHQKWSQGLLYDNYTEQNLIRNFVLGLYNRVDMGTGHGWSAVQSVLWNCNVTDEGVIGLQHPPTSQNYAIGCTAGSITGKPIAESDFPIGYVESQNKPIENIPSLYEAQLNARLIPSDIPIPEGDKKCYSLLINENGVNIIFSVYQDEQKKINIYSLDGKMISSFESSDNPVSVPLQAKGMYIIRIFVDNQHLADKVVF